MADSLRSGNCLLKNLDDVMAVIKECEGKFIAVFDMLLDQTLKLLRVQL